MKKQSFILLLFLLAILIVFSIFILSKNPKNNQPCLSLSFDDGSKSHYEIAYPLLKEKNFGATFFIIANESPTFPNEKLMTSEQIQKLKEEGYEIGSHTLSHPFLTKLNEKEMEKEIKESKNQIEEKYNISITSIAFPYGDFNSKMLNIAKKHYLNARVIYNKDPSAFFLHSLGLKKDTSTEEICQYINYAKENNLWLILVLHEISENPKTWDTSIKDFKEILNCAEDSKIEVSSIQECKEKIL